MLTQAQLSIIGEALMPLYQGLEKWVISDIARRLVKMQRYTETAELQAQSLRELGYSPTAIQRAVMLQLNGDAKFRQLLLKNTAEYKKELAAQIRAANNGAKKQSDEVIHEVGNMAFREDMSLWRAARIDLKRPSSLSQIVAVASKRTIGDLLNLTKTAAFQYKSGAMVEAQKAFTGAMNNALIRVASGAQSYTSAIHDAVQELADSGLRTIDYASGVHRQLDTAVRNALVTTANQLSGDISIANCEATGVEHVEVSAHWGARTDGTGGHGDHQAWQGKVYRRHGSDDKYRNLADATGYPDDPTGLKGYNCRHEFYPFWAGISEPTEWPEEPAPVEYNGKTYTYYEATQKQRSLERTIKRYKRRAYAEDALGENSSATRGRVEVWKDEYERFSSAANLRPEWSRTMVEGEGAADWNRIFKRDKKVEKVYNSNGQSVTVVGRTTIRGTPNSITQVVSDGGYVTRNFYDADGRQIKQISNNNHGNPKRHQLGNHGEHAHDYIYSENGKTSRPMRELTDQEREENADIL